MTENNIMDFLLSVVLGFVTWFFGGIDGLLQVLIAFCIIDYFTGIIAAALNHELSSRVGFRGIVKKIILFMFVGMAHLLDSYLPGDSGSIRAVVCLFYVVNEGISIIENAEKIGVPIPKPLHNMLAKIHDMTQINNEPEYNNKLDEQEYIKEKIYEQEHSAKSINNNAYDNDNAQEPAEHDNNEHEQLRKNNKHSAKSKSEKNNGAD